ncbi:hypothetical protein CAEBREN_13468 [Caenorhabditis brenneri]|uniref:Receptor L-domain domain-containing protein n=1 Tax=Caenorhabditis brenneri TaxID=135651 RepID=G0MUG6_CAEBE|nr:hypothetical protein CAEBREN_13468 [Caenorhabditis brenneri]
MNIDENTDLTEEQLTSTFQNMKHLVGSLIVITTKYTSMKFMAPLESIECGERGVLIVLNPKMTELGMANLTTINCSVVNIDDNLIMKKLNLPNLKIMSPSGPNDTEVVLKIDGLDKNFCITTQEMYNLINMNTVKFKSLFGMHCEPAVPVTNGKVCDSSYTLIYPTNILDGCTQYFGSLVILPENEKDVAKLKTVEMVFGPLYIGKTNLTRIDFLDNLKYISTLGYDVGAIKIDNNSQLSNFSFPSLKRIYSDVAYSVSFENNSQVLAYDPSFCVNLQSKLKLDGYYTPRFDTMNCEALQTAANNRPKASKTLEFVLSIVTVILSSYLAKML